MQPQLLFDIVSEAQDLTSLREVGLSKKYRQKNASRDSLRIVSSFGSSKLVQTPEVISHALTKS